MKKVYNKSSNMLTESDISSYVVSDTKRKMYAAYELNMPYISELLFRNASLKEKQLMVVDIIVNCDSNLKSFLNSANKFGALDNMIYILGGSLYDLIEDDDDKIVCLEKYYSNFKNISLGMSDKTKEIIKKVFTNKNVSEKDKLDKVVTDYKKMIKTKEQN